jgi:hypothetical protein
LDVLGATYGLLPSDNGITLISILSPEEKENTNRNKKELDVSWMSNKDLQNALESEEAFDKLYLDTTLKALSYYTSCSRQRSILRLKHEIANLHL